jgi:uncharacterized membrane protein YhaH (DUF805 family)
MDKDAIIAQFNEYFLNVVFKKYALFEGRARRKEFWMFTLFEFIIGVVFGILAMIPLIGGLFAVVSWIFYLAVFIPSLALGIRRLHDTDRKGILFLLILIPIAGIIILIVFWVQEGAAGANKFGPNPKDGLEAGSTPAATATVEKTVFCGGCGAKNETGTKFCGECGKPLT